MNFKMRTAIIGSFLFLFCLILPLNETKAQTPGLMFRYLTTSDGLCFDDVRCVFQDSKGFMWIGTDGGVDRYDGVGFKNFTQLIRDTTDNLLQGVTGIAEDDPGNLWFINDTNGLVMINKYHAFVKRFVHDPGDNRSLSNKHIRKIFNDSHNNLWISTLGGGLNLFNRKDSTFIRFTADSANPSAIASNYLSDITEDQQGNIWISTIDGYLIRKDYRTGRFHNIRITKEGFTFYADMRINVPGLYIDAENQVWCAWKEALYCYNPKTEEIKQFNLKLNDASSPFHFITFINEIEEGVLTIGTFNSGLFLYDIKRDKLTEFLPDPGNPYAISSNRLSYIYHSAEGVWWIGTYNDGLNIYSRNYVRFPSLTNMVDTKYIKDTRNSVYSLAETPDQRILLGTENNGIFIFDKDNRSLQPAIPELNDCVIFDIFRDKFNNFWISTWINGLYQYNWNKQKLKRIESLPVYTPPDFLNSLSRFFIDRRNRQWFGSMNQGLMLYEPESNTSRLFQNIPGKKATISNNMIYKIFEDRSGNIWVGTSNGLNLYDPVSGSFIQKAITVKNAGNIKNLIVHDIYQSKDGRLWIGCDRGLLMYDQENDQYKLFKMSASGKSVLVLKILEDNSNILWLGTSAGPHSYNPATGKITNYGLIDGITYMSNNPCSGLKSSNGYLYFGSQKGVIIFDSPNIRKDTLGPPVFFTDILINDVPIEIGSKSPDVHVSVSDLKKIVLKYNQSNINFKFVALSFNNPQANRYAYQMVGYDKNWIEVGNTTHAHYRNLSPGKYIFRVKASNSHGVWNETGASIEIIIKQPLWRNIWFRIGLAVFMLSVVVLIYYNRMRNLKRNKLLLEGIVKSRTKELNEANITLTEQHTELVQQHEEITTQNELLSQMSQEILKQNSELEQHRTNLEKLVVERTRELEIAVQKAKESDRLKTAFLANMSHEIRTPMNAIVGFANLLKDSDLEPSERNEFIDVINANSETLLVLIDDILDLSLIESNQLNIRREIFNVNEMLDNMVSSYSLMNKKRQLSISLNNQLHEESLQLNSDKIRIKQILVNLINNAYKFTEKGSIEIGLSTRGAFLTFFVKDTGIGIEEAELDAIFERFRKSETSNNTLYRGAGLGLAISKSMAHLLGGDLYAESIIGKGSTFFLLLPLTDLSKIEPDHGDFVLPKNFTIGSGRAILIVEDERANYMYAKKMLEKLDVQIQWVENGLEAVRLIQSGAKFHMILMDIKMPVMDGFEATKNIKSLNPEQIVIALTAYARPEDRQHFMKAGFDDYLAKPIKPNDFLNVIRQYL